MNKFFTNSVLQVLMMLVFVALMVNINLNTPRTDFLLLILQFAASFGILLYLFKQNVSWKVIFLLGLGTRIALIWGTPELSNDFFRFLWDGELLLQGINPFAHKPNDLISHSAFLGNEYYRILFHGMGELSQANYSCYPVLNQFFFMIGGLFSDSLTINVIVLKLVIILADIGVFIIGTKILKLLNLSIEKIGWFFINPFILLEFTVNLHFEGVMLFFILLSFYFVLKGNWFIGAICLGLAIHVKLIPLLFIPFFYKHLGFRKSLGFTALVLLVALLIGQLLITPENYQNFMTSVQLYFNNFQFNASLFNWINKIYAVTIGWDANGWGTTEIVGPVLAKIALILIITLGVLKAYIKQNDFIIGILFALVIYYAFATTVHPWYISLILTFSIFTKYNFGIVWSALIMVSYLAYSDPNFTENTVLNALAYALLYGYLAYEIKKHWTKGAVGLQLKTFFGIKTQD